MTAGAVRHLQDVLGRAALFATLGAAGIVTLAAISTRERQRELGQAATLAVGGLFSGCYIILTIGLAFCGGMLSTLLSLALMGSGNPAAPLVTKAAGVAGFLLGFVASYFFVPIAMNLGIRLAKLPPVKND